MMGDIKFLDTLRAYDKDNIPQVSSLSNTFRETLTIFAVLERVVAFGMENWEGRRIGDLLRWY